MKLRLKCCGVKLWLGEKCECRKNMIIERFRENVKGKCFLSKKKHCGSEGHWLEQLMGIKNNCDNVPDLYGFELKKDSPKITLGDFSASEYLFTKNNTISSHNIGRTEFIKYFGTPKNGRYSWSGKCVPKYGMWNECGQTLIFNDNNDLCAYYSFEKDHRETKDDLPHFLKATSRIIIAIWCKEKLQCCVENKFNKKGFFICKKENGVYNKICFGKPFDFSCFVENVKNRNIIFDSGMYEGNTRNYSQFRSGANNFWKSLIVEEFE